MAPRHPEIRQQPRHGLAGHRRTPIGVDAQLAWHDPLPRAGLGDQPLGQRGATIQPVTSRLKMSSIT